MTSATKTHSNAPSGEPSVSRGSSTGRGRGRGNNASGRSKGGRGGNSNNSVTNDNSGNSNGKQRNHRTGRGGRGGRGGRRSAGSTTVKSEELKSAGSSDGGGDDVVSSKPTSVTQDDSTAPDLAVSTQTAISSLSAAASKGGDGAPTGNFSAPSLNNPPNKKKQRKKKKTRQQETVVVAEPLSNQDVEADDPELSPMRKSVETEIHTDESSYVVKDIVSENVVLKNEASPSGILSVADSETLPRQSPDSEIPAIDSLEVGAESDAHQGSEVSPSQIEMESADTMEIKDPVAHDFTYDASNDQHERSTLADDKPGAIASAKDPPVLDAPSVVEDDESSTAFVATTDRSAMGVGPSIDEPNIVAGTIDRTALHETRDNGEHYSGENYSDDDNDISDPPCFWLQALFGAKKVTITNRKLLNVEAQLEQIQLLWNDTNEQDMVIQTELARIDASLQKILHHMKE